MLAFAEAAQLGLISPQRALNQIARYVSLPTANSVEGVVGAVMDALNAGKRLPLAGERRTSDAEIDAALDGIKGRGGDPYMKRVREKESH